jgi:mRNA interferase MazF
MKVAQGDIFMVNLNPIKGAEQAGLRPVLVISGPTMNEFSKLVMICPLSSKLKDFSNCLVLEKNKSNGLKTNSQVLTFHVRSISKERLQTKLGSVTKLELKKVFQDLSDILNY